MSKKPHHLVWPTSPTTLRRRLLKWYDASKRDLPWRVGCPSSITGSAVNPYFIWLSETMLQQTQVATVVDYFLRFTQTFPTVHDLAHAPEQAVLTQWQGLGYYRRARHLHAAAKVIVDQHDGEMPQDPNTLQKLPGVGRYSAAAIASIAFAHRVGVVDGNVARVFARLGQIEQPIDQPATQKILWTLADELADSPRPGDVNQAVMELGATVCTPSNPNCSQCPFASSCVSYQSGDPQQLPIKTPKKKPTAVTHRVLALSKTQRGQRVYLFQQRPAQGLWSSMWQLPTQELPPHHAAAKRSEAAGKKAITPDLQTWAHQTLGLTISTPKLLTSFPHQTTHRSITFEIYQATVTQGRLLANVGHWRTLTNLDDLPLPNPQHHIVMQLREQEANPPSSR